MTEQRRVIARILSLAHDHPDVEEVYHRAARVDNKISIATVYRTVRLFEEAGILERHDFRDGRSRYEQVTRLAQTRAQPDALWVARIAARELAAHGPDRFRAAPAPLYLRAPDAKLPGGIALAEAGEGA